MKGRTNNPNGRPQGIPNKATTNLKEQINFLIENNFEKLQSDLDTLEPKDRINTILKLIEFVLPKQKEVILEEPLRLGIDAFKAEYV